MEGILQSLNNYRGFLTWNFLAYGRCYPLIVNEILGIAKLNSNIKFN